MRAVQSGRSTVNKPRHLKGQDAWYYLPNSYHPHLSIEIHKPNPLHQSIKIPARSLYRQLKAIYERKEIK